MVGKITEYLIETQSPISKVKIYSKLPGIYAFFFIGKNFPLEGFKVSDNRIIYIGKTESSQQSRDANTHFKTGRTGSSTVRKSIGALLSQIEQINPVIRSTSDFVNGRSSHFKYDHSSEERITEWMYENLAVAFYEYPQGKEAISSLEIELIQYLKPVLNIGAKNTDNSFKILIKKLRKQLGLTARVNFIRENRTLGVRLTNEINTSKKGLTLSNNPSDKYLQIWDEYSDEIHIALKSRIIQNTIQLDKCLFEKVGKRKNYSFRLEYINGEVANNIMGSAVARDLNRFLVNNKFQVESRTFKLTNDFRLLIKKC